MRALPVTLASLIALVFAGCSTNAKTLQPPNITGAMNRTVNQTRRVELILQVLDKDVLEAKSLRSTFFALKPQTYKSPYPLDLFKQTAMSCLNQPLSVKPDDQDESYKRVRDVLKVHKLTIGCTPQSFPQLILRVEQNTPGKMAMTLQQLVRVDQLRTLRSQIRQRTSKLAPLMRQQRLYLDQQRLSLRRLRQKVNRRRQEYSAQDYQKARQQLDAWQRSLNAYDQSIRAVEKRRGDWRESLRVELRQFYFDLAGLYASDPLAD